MGIDTEVRTLALKSWATDAFKCGTDVRAVRLRAGHVVVEDALCRILHATTPAHSKLFTTRQLYEVFIGPMQQELRESDGGTASVYVAICDDEATKSVFKSHTHAERGRATAAVQPYASSCTFVAGGIVHDVVRKPDQVALIDVDRLAKSRWLRIKLWRYFANALKYQTFIPAGKLVVFEFDDATGPLLFPNSAAWPAHIPRPATWKHEHSEADIALKYWSRIFTQSCTVTAAPAARPQQVMTVSTDTDQIPIMVCYVAVSKHLKAGVLFWSYAPGVLVDMVEFTYLVCRATRLTPMQFMLFCVLTGTDYVDKQQYARGFGSAYILHACIKAKSALDRIMHACNLLESTEEETESEVVAGLDEFVRTLYTYGRTKAIKKFVDELKPPQPAAPSHGTKCKRKSDQISMDEIATVQVKSWEDIRSIKAYQPAVQTGDKKTKPTYRLPTPEDLQVTAKQIIFNVRFWLDNPSIQPVAATATATATESK